MRWVRISGRVAAGTVVFGLLLSGCGLLGGARDPGPVTAAGTALRSPESGSDQTSPVGSGAAANPGGPAAEVPAVTADRPPVQFPAHWDARWRFERAEPFCRLTLAVPRYGAVSFVAPAGRGPGDLAFELLASRDLMAHRAVSWRRRAPSWHPQHPSSGGWEATVELPGLGVRVGMPSAERMALELYGGYELDLASAAQPPELHSVWLSISSIGFRRAFDAFRQCQQPALPQALAALERTRIQFATGSHRLSLSDRDRLQVLARYVTADPAVQRVFVDGHTDAVGKERANLSLSKQRAEAVYQALVDAGVEPELLALRYHGERYPVERTADGRPSAANRRATVRVDLGER
ncbi:MAG: OmpA family protein [Pseudomonadota bacterium]